MLSKLRASTILSDDFAEMHEGRAMPLQVTPNYLQMN
jgi:hypothetical protein